MVRLFQTLARFCTTAMESCTPGYEAIQLGRTSINSGSFWRSKTPATDVARNARHASSRHNYPNTKDLRWNRIACPGNTTPASYNWSGTLAERRDNTVDAPLRNCYDRMGNSTSVRRSRLV